MKHIKYTKSIKQGVYDYRFRMFGKQFMCAISLGRTSTNENYEDRADNRFIKDITSWLNVDKNQLTWEQEKD